MKYDVVSVCRNVLELLTGATAGSSCHNAFVCFLENSLVNYGEVRGRRNKQSSEISKPHPPTEPPTTLHHLRGNSKSWTEYGPPGRGTKWHSILPVVSQRRISSKHAIRITGQFYKDKSNMVPRGW